MERPTKKTVRKPTSTASSATKPAASRAKKAATPHVDKSALVEPRMPSREEIAKLAHELSAQAGHQPGRDVEFWLEAERRLKQGIRT